MSQTCNLFFLFFLSLCVCGEDSGTAHKFDCNQKLVFCFVLHTCNCNSTCNFKWCWIYIWQKQHHEFSQLRQRTGGFTPHWAYPAAGEGEHRADKGAGAGDRPEHPHVSDHHPTGNLTWQTQDKVPRLQAGHWVQFCSLPKPEWLPAFWNKIQTHERLKRTHIYFHKTHVNLGGNPFFQATKENFKS